MTRVLVVDDDQPLLRALRITLTASGYRVTATADGATALAAAAHNPPDIIVLDLGLPDIRWCRSTSSVRAGRCAADGEGVELVRGSDEPGVSWLRRVILRQSPLLAPRATHICQWSDMTIRGKLIDVARV
jgi:CheY-like chemotaxis protein